MDPSDLNITVRDTCPICDLPIRLNSDKGALLIPETHIPGFYLGKSSRLIGFHPECAPDYVLKYHEWLAKP